VRIGWAKFLQLKNELLDMEKKNNGARGIEPHPPGVSPRATQWYPRSFASHMVWPRTHVSIKDQVDFNDIHKIG
jgi:hypothetical protein